MALTEKDQGQSVLEKGRIIFRR